MNTTQLHVTYLLKWLDDVITVRHESFPKYNVGCEKCSTLFLTITVANLDRFL